MSKENVRDINQARANRLPTNLEDFIREHNRAAVSKVNPLKIRTNQRAFELWEKTHRSKSKSNKQEN